LFTPLTTFGAWLLHALVTVATPLLLHSLAPQGARVRVVPAKFTRLSVRIEVPADERGPDRCPNHLVDSLTKLTSTDSGVRLRARQRLAASDWRNLRWMRKAARTGGAEHRLALRWVITQLENRKYSGRDR